MLPVRVAGADVGRAAAGALRWAPVVGALLGAVAGALLVGLAALGVPAAGLLAVGFLALATRGMHLDGLADTADGLGCYGPPERALAVMRDGGVGAFAVVTLVVVLGVQAAALTELAARSGRRGRGVGPGGGDRPGRVRLVRPPRGRRRPAGRAGRDGRGLAAGVGGAAVVGRPWPRPVAVVPGRPWQGPLAVALAAAVVVGLSAHTRRRFGGVTGDVLGAANELAATAALVVLAAG